MYTHGFTLLREEAIAEIGGTAKLWKHTATGAELLSVINTDENKCFGVALRTPPPDSTGVAHILEHSVLCGSEKYPVREPFVELLKGSLQTFLNAFTFPDKTCYPVASTNLQDFYNLVDVYIDAVFHPRISEDIFRQEGWQIEAQSADGPFVYKGVVYNEMKGVYSTPDSVLAEQSQQAVFPDMVYSLDSGGNPEAILSLTYAQFKDFHTHYYHPSNARFFFWGDDPEERRLAILDKELARHTARPAESAVPLQPRRSMPRHIEIPYAVSEGEDRALFTMNWLLCESADIDNALVLAVLEQILEGLPGSPLRKALIESGLGEDLAGIGLECDLRQMYYSVGLKGLAAQDISAGELCIFDTLAGLVENGIDTEAVEAAVNSVEFDLRENNSGRFPRGLAALIQSLTSWLYDGDPLAPLRWEAPLAALKARLALGEKVFERALQQWFLDNEHRVTVVLLPDRTLAERRAAAEQARLNAVYTAYTHEERIAFVQESERLRLAQETPESQEALATIPGLTLDDLPRTNAVLPLEKRHIADVPLLWHELDTSGIVYASLLLPLAPLPERLMPLLPLYARALTEMGTRRHDFVRFGTRIAAKTGGIWAAPLLGTARDGSTVAYMTICGKAVADKTPDFFDILQEMLFEPHFDDIQRFGYMLLEAKARLEHGLAAAGHAAVSARLRARYTVSGWLEELTGGFTHLDAVRGYIERLESDWDAILADLLEIHSLILRRDGALMDCTASADILARVEREAAALATALPPNDPALVKPPAQEPQWACPVLPQGELFTAPTQVNYVGKGANVYALGYRYHGSAQVILRHLRMGYLWEKVRVQGGAYGAFCTLDRMGGTFVQASYRDPSMVRTLATYDAAPDYLRNFTPDSRELTRAIVGAIGDLDTYLLPDAKGAVALTRYLCQDTPELRQQMRDEIFSTTAQHFKDFAEVLDETARTGSVCVLGGPAASTEARAHGWKVQPLL